MPHRLTLPRMGARGPGPTAPSSPPPTVAGAVPAYRIVLDGLPEIRTRVVASRDLLMAAVKGDPQVRLDCVVNGDLTVTSSRQGTPRAVPTDITGAPVVISVRTSNSPMIIGVSAIPLARGST